MKYFVEDWTVGVWLWCLCVTRLLRTLSSMLLR